MPMSLSLGSGLGHVSTSSVSGEPAPPEGFEFVTQDAEIVTQDGDPVYVPEV